MKRVKTKFISNLLLCFGLLFAVLAILCILLPGCVYTLTVEGYGQAITTEMKVLLYGLIFGNPEIIVTVIPGGSTSFNAEGGIGFLGLIGFILVAIGLLTTLVAVFLKNKAKVLCVLSFLVILVGACLMMAVLTTGTDITINGISGSYVEGYEGFKLGVGPILFFVSGLLSSGFVLGSGLTR